MTYEYAIYKPAVEFFRRKLSERKCEIGYHLHVWTTPPFSREKNGVDIDWIQAYQYELPDKIFKAKADTLLETIYNSFKISPVTHRAGRWGIDERTINWLIENNFKVDTSVVPYFNMEDSIGKEMIGPNFENKPLKEYYWTTKKGKILEIPVSVYRNFHSAYNILTNYTNIISLSDRNILIEKFSNKLFKKRMLRPHPNYPNSFYRKAILNHNKNNNSNVVNMMLHSSELKINSSPISKTNKEVNRNWEILEYIFNLINILNIESYSMSDLWSIYKQK